MQLFARAAVLGALITIGFATAASADVTLMTTQRGWYDSSDSHNLGSDNYAAADFSSVHYHDFFVFDLGSVSGTITGAQLNLYEPVGGYSSPYASELFRLFDVSTPVATLVSDKTVSGAFSDLGTGVEYGSVSISAADDGTTIAIDLNTQALAALNSAEGTSFAIGGALNEFLVDPMVFSGSGNGQPNPGDGATTLDLQIASAVPEPATWMLMTAALFGLGFAVRRRHAAA